ncbi:unnamed protein product [Schistosoma mattheei]|uniref:Uncharacterized protein n=1 Tax=Schistosoma mattheei TaxID=31246 RepID=A0A183Q2M7_9TREM|nr:unnamed protein product [Schistosoma mattheei]
MSAHRQLKKSAWPSEKSRIHSEYRSNQDAYLIQLENLVAQLPVVNYTLLKHLCQFLHHVSVYQSDNKMSIESLGIVFGPNVFRFTPENLVSFSWNDYWDFLFK